MKRTAKLLSFMVSAVLVLASAMPAFAAAANVGYADVAETDWYAGAVAYVTEQHLMNGTGQDKFSPNESTNLAMLVTILHRDAGSPAACLCINIVKRICLCGRSISI